MTTPTAPTAAPAFGPDPAVEPSLPEAQALPVPSADTASTMSLRPEVQVPAILESSQFQAKISNERRAAQEELHKLAQTIAVLQERARDLEKILSWCDAILEDQGE